MFGEGFKRGSLSGSSGILEGLWWCVGELLDLVAELVTLCEYGFELVTVGLVGEDFVGRGEFFVGDFVLDDRVLDEMGLDAFEFCLPIVYVS